MLRETPVVKEMNKPRIIPFLGLEAIPAIFCVALPLICGLLWSWLAAIFLLIALFFVSRRLKALDPKFLELWSMWGAKGTEYDPQLIEDLNDFPND